MVVSVPAFGERERSTDVTIAPTDPPEGSTRFIKRAAYRVQILLAQAAEKSSQTRDGYNFEVSDKPSFTDMRQVVLSWGPENQRSISVVVTSEHLAVTNFERDAYLPNPVEIAQGLRIRDMYSVEGRRKLQKFFKGKIERTTPPYVPPAKSPFN